LPRVCATSKQGRVGRKHDGLRPTNQKTEERREVGQIPQQSCNMKKTTASGRPAQIKRRKLKAATKDLPQKRENFYLRPSQVRGRGSGREERPERSHDSAPTGGGGRGRSLPVKVERKARCRGSIGNGTERANE